MQPIDRTIKGRGAAENPANRFVRLSIIPDPDAAPDDRPAPATEFYRDTTRTIIARNTSPDIPFEASLNPYRGCEHGCIYCYARPTHEYLGFSAGLDFESKIVVKEDAPELLRKELSSPNWVPKPVAISGVTDAYQPIERKLRLTRRCLEVFLEFNNPATICTKNALVTRDIDILSQMARRNLTAVFLSITTLDPGLSRLMEPRTAAPRRRLEAIEKLTAAGIPAGVLVSPVIPALTDHEMPAILEAAASAGAISAGWQLVRLPMAVGELFENWLARHFPDRKDKVLSRIRAIRGGQLDDTDFATRMSGQGIFADQIAQIFDLTCRRLHLNERHIELSTDHFRRPGQMLLFPQ